MRLILITVIAAALLPLDGEADAGRERKKLECDAVKEKIRTIESKMRSGYTRAQGERYEAKLRELKTKRYRLCR